MATSPRSPSGRAAHAHANLKESYRRLSLQNKELESDSAALRGRLVDSRSATEKARREALRYKREAERVTAENKRMSHEAELQKAFVRKIESRVALGTTGNAIATRYHEARLKLREQDATIETLRARRGADQRDFDALEMQLRVATRAIETKLSRQGLSGSISKSLLLDVAASRQQEEDALALQETQRDALATTQRDLDEMRARAVTLVQERDTLESQLERTEVQLQQTITTAERHAAHIEQLSVERARMLRVIQRMAALETRRGELKEQQLRMLTESSDADAARPRGAASASAAALLDALAAKDARTRGGGDAAASGVLVVAPAEPSLSDLALM